MREYPRATCKAKELLPLAASQPTVDGPSQMSSKFFGVADSEDSMSESETDVGTRNKFLKDKFLKDKTVAEGKSKPTRRRRAVGEPTIAERMHSVKEHLEEIEISTVAQLTASAKEWLKDMELIRSKTAYAMQGTLSGRIRERIEAFTTQDLGHIGCSDGGEGRFGLSKKA